MHKSFFGLVIKNLRLQREWTQEYLASISNLERTFISMLERGVKQPSLKTIGDIAQAFGIKSYELLHLVEQEMHATTVDNGFDRALEEERIAALEAEEERVRIGEIADSIPIVFFARTPMPEYAVTFVSKNVSQLLGFDREKFLEPGKFWQEHVHPDDQIRIISHLQKMRANGLVNHEYRFLTADGQWLQVREELRLIADDAGTPREVLGSLTGESN
jgi:transcriptional regulator with XRE-family HTH domain